MKLGAEFRDELAKLPEPERDEKLNELAKFYDTFEDAICIYCRDERDKKTLYSWMCCKDSFFCETCLEESCVPEKCPVCKQPVGEWQVRVHIYDMFSVIERVFTALFWSVIFSIFHRWIGIFAFFIPVVLFMKSDESKSHWFEKFYHVSGIVSQLLFWKSFPLWLLFALSFALVYYNASTKSVRSKLTISYPHQ